MSSLYCPECGAEYVAGTAQCAECVVTLVTWMPEPRDEVGDEEAVYELADWEPEERSTLSRYLTNEGIPHQWEDEGDLVVREGDAERVEALLDQVEGAADLADELDADAEEEAPGDEVPYEVVSDLFLAADRLMRAPDDVALVDDVVAAAQVVEATAPPYGFAPETWARVKGLAAALRVDVRSGADDDAIVRGARTLRELLADYV